MESQAAEIPPIPSDPLKEALHRLGPAPSSGTPSGKATEPLEPPLKPKVRRGVFEGDAAAVELRARLAKARAGIPSLAVRAPAPSRLGPVLRFIGLILVAAVLAGTAGYIVGAARHSTKLARSAKSARLAAASTRADMPIAQLTPAAPRDAPDRKSEPQGEAADGPPATSGRAPDNAVEGEAAQQRRTPASASAPPPPLPRPDASAIAARMKIGADLMAAGDLTAARMIFERVAEAGDAAGAFALAETYDPTVLRKLRLRGGITPDPALARRWYEKARDMGSSAAPERIARLTRNSK
jgi:hypothetical protein